MASKSNKPHGLLLAISGPSGVGKTTITRELERRLDGVFSVSATTRPQAPGEVDGRDYHFLTEQQFEDRVGRGAFLEHAQVYSKHRYGPPREPVDRHLAQIFGKLGVENRTQAVLIAIREEIIALQPTESLR